MLSTSGRVIEANKEPPMQQLYDTVLERQSPSGVLVSDGFWSIEDILEMYPMEYMIDGLLPERSHAMLYAPTSHLKTFMAIHLAGCVATGMSFGDRPSVAGEVIYVAAEAAPEVATRLLAWQHYHGYRHQVMHLMRDISFKDRNGLDVLRSGLERRGDRVKLVVFDTAARCASGIDESSNTEVNENVNRQIDRLIRDYGISALLVHHTGHDQRRPRGAAAWEDACDTVMRVRTRFQEPVRRKGPITSTLEVEKMRMGEPIHISFVPTPYEKTLVLVPSGDDPIRTSRRDGEPRHRGGNRRQDNVAKVMQALEELESPTKLEIVAKTGLSRATVFRILSELRPDA